MDSEIGLTKCPRCGRDTMRIDIALNALSRYIDVYICSECGIEEAMLDLDGKSLSLKDWYLSRLFSD
jgi:transposase-like protein